MKFLRIAKLWAEIGTWDLLNTKDCQSLNSDIVSEVFILKHVTKVQGVVKL
jgi:hypothetical protein